MLFVDYTTPQSVLSPLPEGKKQDIQLLRLRYVFLKKAFSFWKKPHRNIKKKFRRIQTYLAQGISFTQTDIKKLQEFAKQSLIGIKEQLKDPEEFLKVHGKGFEKIFINFIEEALLQASSSAVSSQRKQVYNLQESSLTKIIAAGTRVLTLYSNSIFDESGPNSHINFKTQFSCRDFSIQQDALDTIEENEQGCVYMCNYTLSKIPGAKSPNINSQILLEPPFDKCKQIIRNQHAQLFLMSDTNVVCYQAGKIHHLFKKATCSSFDVSGNVLAVAQNSTELVAGSLHFYNVFAMTWHSIHHAHQAYIKVIRLFKEKAFSGSGDGCIKIWDTCTAKCLSEIPNLYSIREISPSESDLFFIDESRTQLVFFDTTTCQHLYIPIANIFSISRNNDRIYLGTPDGECFSFKLSRSLKNN